MKIILCNHAQRCHMAMWVRASVQWVRERVRMRLCAQNPCQTPLFYQHAIPPCFSATDLTSCECVDSWEWEMLQFDILRCIVLQCVAVFCSVSQCVAECCSVLQGFICATTSAAARWACCAMCFSAMQRAALCCIVLHCVAVSCSALQRHLQQLAARQDQPTPDSCSIVSQCSQCAAVRWSALQCVAVRCSEFQCVAVCCIMLQYDAVKPTISRRPPPS